MPLHRHILVVEDDPAIRAGVCDALRLVGHTTLEACDGKMGLQMALGNDIDLVLLDVVMPKNDGLTVLAHIRREKATLPVIMLTARGTEADKIRGLATGADDYVVKPFSMRELFARVDAVLRRSPERGEKKEKVILKNGASVDFARCVGLVNAKKEVALSGREIALLKYLAQHQERPINREELLRRVWHVEGVSGAETRTVDVCVMRLREKLGEEAIKTVHGKGYLLEIKN